MPILASETRMVRFALISGFLMAICGCRNPADSIDAGLNETPKRAKTIAMTSEFAVPVLMYHRVSNLTESEKKNPLVCDLTVSPADFESQIKFLKENGFEFLYASEIEDALAKGMPLPKRSIAITFDDGYRDNFTDAFPILQKYGAKATLFMVTNNFDKAQRISWSDARTMNKHKVDFQSHTVSHPDLTSLSDEQLTYELAESKSIIENGLLSKVTSVAYPAGSFNRHVELYCAKSGYLAAWKKGGGAVQPGHADNLFELPRVRVHGRTDLEKFKQRALSGIAILSWQRSKMVLRTRSNGQNKS